MDRTVEPTEIVEPTVAAGVGGNFRVGLTEGELFGESAKRFS